MKNHRRMAIWFALFLPVFNAISIPVFAYESQNYFFDFAPHAYTNTVQVSNRPYGSASVGTHVLAPRSLSKDNECLHRSYAYKYFSKSPDYFVDYTLLPVCENNTMLAFGSVAPVVFSEGDPEFPGDPGQMPVGESIWLLIGSSLLYYFVKEKNIFNPIFKK